jgi:hypothetical protein
MRVRMLQPAAGVMDGISLSHLILGLTYDVPPPIAHYLTANGFAEELASTAAALVIPVDDLHAFNGVVGGITVTQTDRAHDKPRRRRGRKKR